MSVFNYNDYYRVKLLQQKFDCCNSINAAFTSSISQLATTTEEAAAVAVTETPFTPSAVIDTYYPTVVMGTGYPAQYINTADKPVTFDSLTNYSDGQIRNNWVVNFECEAVDLKEKSRLINLVDPIDDHDAATLKFVKENSGTNWWQFPAQRDIEISGNTFNNVKVKFDDICPRPRYDSNTGTLNLIGNGTSTGQWYYEMVDEIYLFQISNMADNSVYDLILCGLLNETTKVNFIGGAKNHCFCTWLEGSYILVGPRTYLRFKISYHYPNYFISCAGGYN